MGGFSVLDDPALSMTRQRKSLSLLSCARRGDAEGASAWLAAGADPGAREGRDGPSAFGLFLLSGRPDGCRLVLESGADPVAEASWLPDILSRDCAEAAFELVARGALGADETVAAALEAGAFATAGKVSLLSGRRRPARGVSKLLSDALRKVLMTTPGSDGGAREAKAIAPLLSVWDFSGAGASVDEMFRCCLLRDAPTAMGVLLDAGLWPRFGTVPSGGARLPLFLAAAALPAGRACLWELLARAVGGRVAPEAALPLGTPAAAALLGSQEMAAAQGAGVDWRDVGAEGLVAAAAGDFCAEAVPFLLLRLGNGVLFERSAKGTCLEMVLEALGARSPETSHLVREQAAKGEMEELSRGLRRRGGKGKGRGKVGSGGTSSSSSSSI